MPPKEDYSLKKIDPNIDGGISSAKNKLTLVEPLFYVYVKIHKARNLPLNPVTGTCDPYVEIKIGNYKGRTKCRQNTTFPIWEEVFAFTQDRLHDKKLEIFVKDRAMVGDEIIGKYEDPIGDVKTRLKWDSEFAASWKVLKGKDGINNGDLMYSIWVGNQEDGEYKGAWHSDAASVDVESVKYTRSMAYLQPKLWYLRVKLIEARDLVPSDNNRKLEVYVKVTFGAMVLKTKVSSDKTVNPKWNEELMFVAAEPLDDFLYISVLDKIADDKEECLGLYKFSVANLEKRLIPPPLSDKWVNLETGVVMSEEQKKGLKFASKLNLLAFLDGVYHVFDETPYYSSDLRATSPKLMPGEIGILELGILKAQGLVPMKSNSDGSETTDAYCVAKYGTKWERTRTVVNSLAPKWNEQSKWEVYDPCTVITIGVFDNCNLQKGYGLTRDSIIGKVRIRLSALETDRIYSHAYPLLALKPNGLKKMGELHLVVRFSCISMINLLNIYAQYMLPRAHYLNPLSVHQQRILRLQAVNQLCLSFARAEPPLMKEVVEYMLDAKKPVWSIRRARANFDRLKTCLSFFPAIWKWFDEIRQWNNSLTTVSIWVLFLLLIIFPQLILPNFFFYLSIVGLRNYRNRPRQPPHVDPKLSLAEDASPDDIDEEFDSSPSSKPDEIVRRRYERLRIICDDIASTIGDLAIQLERVHFLVSWRDPRATPMFVVFCVIAGLVVYIVPFRWLLAIAGTYAMRPPRLRVTLPPIPQNFVRRMPAREDYML